MINEFGFSSRRNRHPQKGPRKTSAQELAVSKPRRLIRPAAMMCSPCGTTSLSSLGAPITYGCRKGPVSFVGVC